ncbi:MAG: BatA domain-containing protein [Deltaproteobacteria bacterium]|jgi:hypothetical protein|nr:BatA domain-containing protein [Deltaproteobacteria bacterium]
MIFGNLPFLFLLFALPLLAFAYLNRTQGNLKKVSSILIYKQLAARKVIKQKIKLPLRFFLELTALSLLILALIQPSLKKYKPTNVILFDNSLSMSSVSKSGVSHLQLAVEKVREQLNTEPKSRSWTVFKTSPKLEKVLEEADKNEVLRAINQITVSKTSDNLTLNLAELLQNPVFNKILVVSDKIAGDTKQLTQRVTSLVVGIPQSNAYINSLRLNQDGKLQAGVFYSGVGSATFPVKLFKQVGNSDFKLIEEQKIKLLAGANAQVLFNAQTVLAEKQADAVNYKLEIFPNQTADFIDSIALDNTAQLAVADTAASSILVISQLAKEKLGLKNISNFKFKVIAPEEFNKLAHNEVQRYATLIFHRTAPLYAEHIPTLLILPPRENPLFPLALDKQNSPLKVNLPKVTSFENTHILTSYLKLNLLELKTSLIFKPSKWAQAIINTEQGAIMVAGENEGTRFAGIGFELLPFEGAKTPLTSIMFLNLIDWLNSSSAGFANEIADPTESNTNLRHKFYVNEDLNLENLNAESKKAENEKRQELWQLLILLAGLILLLDFILRLWKSKKGD